MSIDYVARLPLRAWVLRRRTHSVGVLRENYHGIPRVADDKPGCDAYGRAHETSGALHLAL